MNRPTPPDTALLPPREVRSWIDGAPTEGAATTTHVHDPSSGAVISRLHHASADDVDRAARAARAAFPGWSATPPRDRAALLDRIADLVDRRRDEIATVEAIDTGTPLAQMARAVIPRAAQNFRFFAESIRRPESRLYPAGDTHLNYVLHAPVGVAALITPWNMPFMLGSWKIAPALAFGCTAVLKPPELAPLTSAILAQIAAEAGLPPGVLNIVQGDGATVGDALVCHDEVDVISFTGSTATGKRIVPRASQTRLKRTAMELGGKAPLMVFEDADYDRALDAAVLGLFQGNGQRCNATTRMLIHASHYDRFVEDFARRAAALPVGPALAGGTRIGPLISAAHRDKVLGYIASGREAGARLVTGGGPPRTLPESHEGGYYVAPTIFADTDNSMRIVQEEIFGPVACIQRFEEEEEAVTQANGTDYGLSAFVWTRDLSRAHRLANRLEVGMVWINTQIARHLPAPFGGTKQSGFGREGGEYSLETYTNPRNVCLALGDHPIPKW
jgi:5-carboxymethyl-2-hydroxymuconic-semialdehyde dehydrogenase